MDLIAPRHSKWRLAAWAAGLWSALLLSIGQLAAPATGPEIKLTEYNLKANWVFQLTKYVEWPAEALGAPQAPFVIGVVGANPFGNDLVELVGGERVKGHPIQVRRFQAGEDFSSCQLLFVCRSENSRLKAVLGAAARARAVLTVGETADFVKAGGMVCLELADRRICCDLNKAAATQAGLKVRPQLRSVLRSVIE